MTQTLTAQRHLLRISDLDAHDLERLLDLGEPISDTARVLGSYCAAIFIRTFAQADVQELAAHAGVPVVNALTDEHHPCQALADLLTIREQFGRLEGIRLAYVGDGNNV